jgi:hypothetical protein
MGWFLWAVVLAMTARHPRVARYPDVSGTLRIVAICGMLLLVLTFIPTPLTHGSGREAWGEVWPEIRDGSQDTLHDLRDGIRRLLHRK